MIDDITWNVLTLIAGMICGVLAITFIRKDPRRISCGILLILAIYLTISSALYIYAPNTYKPNDEMAIGQGDEIMATFQFIFLIISFFGGIALCFNGVKVIRREGFSLAHFLPIAFGLAGIALPIMVLLTLLMVGNLAILQAYIILLSIVLYVPYMLAVFLLYSVIYAFLPKPKQVDFIVVLGASIRGNEVAPLLAKRLDCAIKFYEKSGKHAKFIVSGGQGSDEKVSEAFAMRKYLLSKGITPPRIIMEDRSTNTLENLQFSRKIMDENKRDYSCLVVTSNYHVLRAVFLARKIGLNAQGVGSKTRLFYLPSAFAREYIAVVFEYKWLIVAYVVYVLILYFGH